MVMAICLILGAHGHRGYDEDIMFTWVAAPVDVPYQSSTRFWVIFEYKLYFFRMKFEDETTNELLNYATVGQEFNKKIHANKRCII